MNNQQNDLKMNTKEIFINEHRNRFQSFFNWLGHKRTLSHIQNFSEGSEKSLYKNLSFYETKNEVVWDAYGEHRTGEKDFPTADIEYEHNSFSEYVDNCASDMYMVEHSIHKEFSQKTYAEDVKIARDFIQYELVRRGMDVVLGDDLEVMIDTVVAHAIKGLDVFAPYTLLEGLGDVVFTDEVGYFQYRGLTRNQDGTITRVDLSPEALESFRYEPKLARNNWKMQYDLGYMGLMLDQLWDTMRDYLGEDLEYSEEVYLYKIQNEPYCDPTEDWEDWMKLAREYGEYFWEILEVGVNSAILWITHPTDPDARMWRYNHHAIYETVYDSLKPGLKITGDRIHPSEAGTALFQDWNLYGPAHFEKIPRPARSCAKCGITEHCVELRQSGAGAAVEYFCEGCASDEIPFPNRECGSKMCSKVECLHHKRNGMSEEERHMYKKRFNQMMARALEIRRFGEMNVTIDHAGRRITSRSYDGFIAINDTRIENNMISIAEVVAQNLLV